MILDYKCINIKNISTSKSNEGFCSANDYIPYTDGNKFDTGRNETAALLMQSDIQSKLKTIDGNSAIVSLQ